MSEGDPGPLDAGGGGGGSFWTSLPTILTASAVFIGAIVSAVVALRGGGDGEATPTTTHTTTSAPEWHSHFALPLKRGFGKSYYDGETMFVQAGKAQPMVVLADRDGPLRDVRMSVHATWFSGDTDYGVGFICRHANPSNYYFLSVLSKGEYHIARYRKGDLVSLTGGPQPKDALRGDEHDVDARCVGSDPVILTLSVDGREIATVRDDDGIEEGNVGIRVGSSGSVTCSFRDFKLSSLE
jgi:hypothetical protein